MFEDHNLSQNSPRLINDNSYDSTWISIEGFKSLMFFSTCFMFILLSVLIVIKRILLTFSNKNKCVPNNVVALCRPNNELDHLNHELAHLNGNLAHKTKASIQDDFRMVSEFWGCRKIIIVHSKFDSQNRLFQQKTLASIQDYHIEHSIYSEQTE
jgi:hypothetical protein